MKRDPGLGPYASAAALAVSLAAMLLAGCIVVGGNTKAFLVVLNGGHW